MTRNLVCNDCGGILQEGYLAQLSAYGDNATFPDLWIEGPPKRNFWGFSSAKNRARFKVSAYRCDRCGVLKFYALPEKSSDYQE